MKKKCLLAYSGGLDTTAIIPWLKIKYNVDVIAYCSNVGNLEDETILEKRALDAGAKDFIFENVESQFVDDFITPSLYTNALYMKKYLLGTALARPLIAKKSIEMAQKLKINYIAHGATGKGNDHIRFEKIWKAIDPQIQIIAPWKLWEFKSREEIKEFLELHTNLVWEESKKNLSHDTNLFHSSTEGGPLENTEIENDPLQLCQWLNKTPHLKSETLELTFQNGQITQINNKNLTQVELIKTLNKICSDYGIGFCDIIETRINSIKSHGVYETPAGTLIQFCLDDLKTNCWSYDLFKTADSLSQIYGELIYHGDWMSDTRFAIDAFFKKSIKVLTGQIKVKLNWNQMIISKRDYPFSLFNSNLVSFNKDTDDLNKASLGYMKFLVKNNELFSIQRGLYVSP